MKELYCTDLFYLISKTATKDHNKVGFDSTDPWQQMVVQEKDSELSITLSRLSRGCVVLQRLLVFYVFHELCDVVRNSSDCSCSVQREFARVACVYHIRFYCDVSGVLSLIRYCPVTHAGLQLACMGIAFSRVYLFSKMKNGFSYRHQTLYTYTL